MRLWARRPASLFLSSVLLAFVIGGFFLSLFVCFETGSHCVAEAGQNSKKSSCPGFLSTGIKRVWQQAFAGLNFFLHLEDSVISVCLCVCL